MFILRLIINIRRFKISYLKKKSDLKILLIVKTKPYMIVEISNNVPIKLVFHE